MQGTKTGTRDASRCVGSGRPAWGKLPRMANLNLFRRREVWLPTLRGWIMIMTLAASAVVVAGRGAYGFLAQDAPEPGAKLMVVEGWLGDGELDQVIVAFRSGSYQRIVTSGGPIENWLTLHGGTSYAEMSARYLREHGLADVDIVAVPAPASAQDRSFLSAVMVRRWMQAQGDGVQPFDVWSSGTHARRTRMVYRAAFGPDAPIGIRAVRPSDHDPERWWRSSAGAKSVLVEAISVVWTACCFHPPAPDSHEETWAVPKRQQTQ
jgi:hypothetical protein